jgi:XTP/dITP diphosphohydrolase
MNSIEYKKIAFERLLKIMDELRAECPWDKKQTMETLRHLSIEEMYELSDAILEGNKDEIKKELGDILLHIVFYSKIGSETNDFDIADVLNGISEKLIRRHPHIYGDVKVKDEEEVKNNWEKIKLAEGNKSVLSGVPKSMPALVKAIRIQDKAKGIGFDWKNKDDVWEKVKEEMSEFEIEAKKENNIEKTEAEFGDLLFSLINYARFININPEDALEKTNKKFIKRFQFIEENALKNNKSLSEMSLEEMEVYWNLAKKL